MIINNSNLRRNLFSNRYKILGVIVAIILILCLIQALNQMLKQQAQKERENKEEVSTTQSQSTYKPQETIIQGQDVPKEKQETNENVMDNFIKYCNSKEIEKAYNLLTEECQELLFNSDIENFKQSYVDKIFTTKKVYNMQSWIQSSIGYTYKVRITDDMLATGNTGEAIEAYYTIVNKDGQSKLNLNSYIGKLNINEEVTLDNITIKVISKNCYMDYEIYEVKVENKTDKAIILDTKQKTKSVYITGENSGTYTGFMHEIDDLLLEIKPFLYRTYNIKFNKIFNGKTRMDNMVFSDIIPDAEKYKNTVNKEEYKERKTIKVEL